MKKRKKIAIIILIFLAVVYFGVKGVLLWSVLKPQSFEIEMKEAFDKRDTIIIKRSISNEDNYFSFENLKIRNDFEPFYENNVYKIKNTDIRVVFSKEAIDSSVIWVKENSKNMGMYYDLTKDLEKNNIDTNYKLLEYYFKNFNPKLNLFSSINAFRKDHAIKLSGVSFQFDKFTVITGDYDGYIYQTNASKAVFINHNNYTYFIHILSKEYSDEKLYDLLSTIVFE